MPSSKSYKLIFPSPYCCPSVPSFHQPLAVPTMPHTLPRSIPMRGHVNADPQRVASVTRRAISVCIIFPPWHAICVYLSLEGSNRSCPARIASRTYNNDIPTTLANENIAPHGIEGSTGNSLALQQAQSYSHCTQPELMTRIPNVPGSSSILASTSRNNHYIRVPPASLTIPTFYQHPT